MWRGLIRDSVLYGIIGGLSRLATVLVVPFYSRLLNSREFGLIDLLSTATVLLLMVGGLQSESAIARDYHESVRSNSEGRLLASGILSSIFGLTVVALMLLLVGKFGSLFAVEADFEVVLPVALMLLPYQLLLIGQLVARFRGDKGIFALLAIGDLVMTMALTWSLVAIYDFGVPGALWAQAISKLVWGGGATLYLFGGGRLREKKLFDYFTIVRSLKYSLPLVPAVGARWLQRYIGQWAVVAFWGLSAAGELAVAMKTGMLVLLVEMAFRLAWTPIAMQSLDRAEEREKYASALQGYLLGLLPLALTICCFSWVGVKILAPESYREAARAVPLFALSFFWDGTLAIVGIGLNAVRKTYWGMLSYGVAAVCNGALLIYLVPFWGVFGVGVAALCSSLLAAALLLFISQKLYPIPYRYKAVFLSLGATFGALAILLLIPEPGSSWWSVFLNAGQRLVFVSILSFGLIAVLRRNILLENP